MSAPFDVAIVGPGTVGLYLAAALPPGLRVALVGTRLDRDELLGPAPGTSGHTGVLDGWAGGAGGTSTRWGGQLWPWQPWEIAGGADRRAWPLDYARDIAPHYGRVLQRLGLDAPLRTDVHERSGASDWPQLRTEFTEVRYSTWMNGGHRNFNRNRSLQRRQARVEAIAGNVARIESRQRGRSALLDAAGHVLAEATTVVLASGTLGNIKLVQSSFPDIAALRPVGRYFGDHLSTRAARAVVVDRRRFSAFAAPTFIRHGRATTRLATTAAFAECRGTMPAYGHFEVMSPTLNAVRRLSRARTPGAFAGPVRDLLGETPSLPRQVAAAAGSARRRQRPIDVRGEVFLRVDVEQPLREDSFVSWDDDGSLRLEWRVGPEEAAATRCAGEAFSPLLEQHIGVELEPIDELAMQDIYHLIGGTRMGSRLDPDAVVDDQLELIGADGVFIVGASTFPSGGMANPTFTALALADRLADRLS